MTLVIGLTGGIGSGKSLVAKIMAEFGAVVIDADRLGHESYLPGTNSWQELVNAFGDRIVDKDGSIDRKKLGDIVFNHKEQLDKLNNIVLPHMKDMAREQIEKFRRQKAKAVVLEAPTLFESGWTDLVDQVWVVVASRPKVIKRVTIRSKMSEEAVLSRINSQLSDEARITKADIMIRNDGSVAELRKQVRTFWDKAIKTAF
ncbi:MAG TPA: dephospho-CoA kinase [Dehalococcoidales bacterium]|nr:dephospho-CoA kinase [Dehalococcoidales bacterium]